MTAGRPPKYPWDSMKTDDSFLVNGLSARAIQQIIYVRNAKSDKRFNYDSEGDSFRVWRVE